MYTSSFYVPGLHGVHPIFSPKDFLDVLIKVKNPNFVYSVGGPGSEGMEGESQLTLGLVKVQMNVQSLFELVSPLYRVRACTCIYTSPTMYTCTCARERNSLLSTLLSCKWNLLP